MVFHLRKILILTARAFQLVVQSGVRKDEKLYVHFDNVSGKCSFITPVPGGVGPMTVTSLMMNTLKAYNKEIYPDIR